MTSPVSRNRVLVTGLGAVTPYGIGVPALEAGLFSGTPAIRAITGFDASHLHVQIAGEVPDFSPEDHLDHRRTGRMDRFSQFAVTASREALTFANLDLGRMDRDRIATVIHTGAGGVPALIEAASFARRHSLRPDPPLMIARYAPNMASAQVSVELGITGPSLTGTGACASGTMAIIEAMHLIQRGEVDVAIAGGAEACVTEIGIVGFDVLGVLSHRNHDPGGANRPFSLDRDGTVLSEGAVVLVLESEAHAVARNASVLAEIAGGALTSDGYHVTGPDPTGTHLARAIHLALIRAEMSPGEIDVAAVHATASKAGDLAETEALKRAFGPHVHKLAISATKSMVGHLIGGAGSLAAASIVLGMQRGEISPTINLDTPDPLFTLDYVSNTARKATIRAAIANGLGFGGQNAVLVLRATD